MCLFFTWFCLGITGVGWIGFSWSGFLSLGSYGSSLCALMVALVLLLCLVIECGRIPYDLSECESELVSGYVTECAALGYGLLVSAEYGLVLSSGLVYCMRFHRTMTDGLHRREGEMLD